MSKKRVLVNVDYDGFKVTLHFPKGGKLVFTCRDEECLREAYMQLEGITGVVEHVHAINTQGSMSIL